MRQTPAANPESREYTGFAAIVSGVAMPPFEVMICRPPCTPASLSLWERLETKVLTLGPRNAFMHAVVKRSNSRNWGETSAEVVTKTPGYSCSTSCRTRFSWAGLR